MNRSFGKLRHTRFNRAFSVFIFSTLIVTGFAGCAEINRLREAQNAFDQAAQAENTLRFNAIPGEEGDAALSAAVRAGYSSVLVSLDKLSPQDERKLKDNKLWGNVLAMKAMAQWRLQNYAAAKDTSQEAYQLQPDDIHPRDKAILMALPGLIRIDQVYSFISYKVLKENERMSEDDFKTSVDTPLSNADDILATARTVVLPNEPVQLYLVQAQLAAYRNLKTAYRKFKPGRDTVPADHKMKKTAQANIQDLSDLLLLLSNSPQQRSELIQYWLKLTNLSAPQATCQNIEICGSQ